MKVDVLLGLQWGDEGKGKVVDVLTPNYDVVTRFQGGPNAGHTLEFNGETYLKAKNIDSEWDSDTFFPHGQSHLPSDDAYHSEIPHRYFQTHPSRHIYLPIL